MNLCVAGPPPALPGAPLTPLLEWVAALAASEWTAQVRTLLSGAYSCAEALHRRGQSVLVHCSDGWDRTAQVCALVQVMLDPFFRTTAGFCTLVAKEWCAFGHPFQRRQGHGRELLPPGSGSSRRAGGGKAGGEADDSDISPVFLLFLDAVTQLVQTFPAAFEFKPRLLLLIAHHSYSCRFGTFLCDNERERTQSGIAYRTPSLWGHIASQASESSLLTNDSFVASRVPDALMAHPAIVLRKVSRRSLELSIAPGLR